MHKLPWIAALLFVSAGATHLVAGCGSETAVDAPTDDGGLADGNFSDVVTSTRDPAADCKPEQQACGSSGECCTANCTDGVCGAATNNCKLPQAACSASTECCTGSCANGTCSSKQCVADNATCGVDSDCCGGSCVADATGHGICKALSTTCSTSGNPCSNTTKCCSGLCNAGICSGAVSFCTQQGDACGSNTDCCTGNCVKAGTSALGICGGVLGGGAGGCSPSGTVCSTGTGPGGVCEQSCCSRSCGPFGGQNGFRVCQPPSGCHPTGEICRAHSDCCGWSGSPDPKKGFVECDKPANAEFGRCNNGNACREPGSICKVGGSLSCSAENNCCETLGQPSGNCNNTPENCCRQDALGIPRCLVAFRGDCKVKPPPGTTCATSADCCDLPCVNNKCLGACVPKNGQCTTTADCCSGSACVAAPGSTKGICGGTLTSDGGVSTGGGSNAGCGLYGQACSANGDCCSGVPCTKAAGATTGTCRYP
jgi:hypothetical protein